MTGIWRVRAAVLTLVGALGVHHGRYAFPRPEHGHEQELAGVHAYLTWVTPVAGVLVALAALELVARLGRAGGATPRLPRGRWLWLWSTLALLAVFGAQESIELWLAGGHAPHPADLLAGGGWTAVPLAVAAGGAIALLLRGAARVVAWALARSSRSAGRRAASPVLVPRAPRLAVPRSVLARRLAGRAPPVLSSST